MEGSQVIRGMTLKGIEYLQPLLSPFLSWPPWNEHLGSITFSLSHGPLNNGTTAEEIGVSFWVLSLNNKGILR